MTDVVKDIWYARNVGDTEWISLHTHRWSLTSMTGRWGAPEMLGENDRVLGDVGEVWLPKKIGGRKLTFGMVVSGWDEDGVLTSSLDGQFNANLGSLMRLLWRHDLLIRLKRLYTNKDGAVSTFYGAAECRNEPDPVFGGTPFRCRVVFDMWMTDPRWYTNEAMTESDRLW